MGRSKRGRLLYVSARLVVAQASSLVPFLRCPVDSPPKEDPLETVNFAGAWPALPSVCSAPLLSAEKKDNSSIFFSHSQSLFLLQHSHVGHSCDDVQPRGLSGPAQRNVPVPARIGK